MSKAKFVSGKEMRVAPVEFGVIEDFRFVTSPYIPPPIPPKAVPVGNWRPGKHAKGRRKGKK